MAGKLGGNYQRSHTLSRTDGRKEEKQLNMACANGRRHLESHTVLVVVIHAPVGLCCCLACVFYNRNHNLVDEVI